MLAPDVIPLPFGLGLAAVLWLVWWLLGRMPELAPLCWHENAEHNCARAWEHLGPHKCPCGAVWR